MKKILFVYNNPHDSHRGFAEAINADFLHYNHYLRDTRLPAPIKGGINGILMPKYDIYLTEGGRPISPVAITKLLRRDAIHINLIADHTFMMLDYPPAELQKEYNFLTNLSHNFALKFIDGAIAVSKMIKSNAEKRLHCPIRLVYPYIQESLFDHLKEINPNINSSNIISVGEGGYHKGMDILVKAFEIAKKEIDWLNLYLIGKNIPAKWREIPGVHVEGYVADITPYFRNASLYIQASRADAFSVAVLEALRAGIPSIVTEMTGTKEVIEQINRDLVVPVDHEIMAKRIIEYFSMNESKKMEYSEKARILSAKFNKQEMCHLFRKEFDTLLEELA